MDLANYTGADSKGNLSASLTNERPAPPCVEAVEQVVDVDRHVANEQQHVDSQCEAAAASEATAIQPDQSHPSYICVPLSSMVICNDVGLAFISLDGGQGNQMISTQQTLESAPYVAGSPASYSVIN